MHFVAGQLGVRGRLRRDQIDIVQNVDQFAQAWWQWSPRWSLLAGLRHSQVRFESDDRYVTGSNPDDSGQRGQRRGPVQRLQIHGHRTGGRRGTRAAG